MHMIACLSVIARVTSNIDQRRTKKSFIKRERPLAPCSKSCLPLLRVEPRGSQLHIVSCLVTEVANSAQTDGQHLLPVPTLRGITTEGWTPW